MLKILKKELVQPKLYQETLGEFWNDDYISAQMLKAHLNPDLDAASRKAEFIDCSVDWINKIAGADEYPLLLDVGCGPGLYAERFTKVGYSVTGVDFSQRSIDYAQLSAQRQGLAIDYIYQNYLTLNLNKQFDLVTMIYCDYGALSPTDRKTLLRNVHQHLRVGGKFIMDVFSLAAYDRFVEGQSWAVCDQGGFWFADSYIELQRRLKYQHNVTLEQYIIISTAQVQGYYIWNSYFSCESLTAELQEAGFKLCKVFGDVAGAQHDAASVILAVVIEK